MAALELDIAVALRSFDLGVSLAVGRETLALVGPSGSGKTTVLRAVAGLRRPDSGGIRVDGRAWFDAAAGVDLPPEARSVGLVFQEHALFPHLSVRANVAFGGRARADEMLERFRIAHLAEAKPTAISGGERQRVALARALARGPRVLLLDEPLSSLDAHTRAVVRAELEEVLAGVALPTLLVTHDFRDAAALAGRVAVIADGRLRQAGSPADLVARPADAFVASLTGGNLLTGTAEPLAGGGSRIVLDDGTVVHAEERARGRVGVAVYPWEVGIAREAPGDGRNAVPGAVGAAAPEGGRVRQRVGPMVAERPAAELDALALRRGEWALATFPRAAVRLVAVDERHAGV
jgi:molybdate transport system ATP-binding protein